MTKPRYFVLTDVSVEEPDDQQSLVRLMLYSCDIDIEGLVATSSQWKAYNNTGFRVDIIERVLAAYEQVEDNLRLHRAGYPSVDYLRSLVAVGNGNNMEAVGKGRESKGSELLASRILADDPRPLWVGIWGGASTLAQALWTLREMLTPEELAPKLRKLWAFEIQGQDDAGAWIAIHFPDLHFVRCQQIWRGISTHVKGEWFEARGDFEEYVSPDWFAKNIQKGHGSLGQAYPSAAYLHEGDTPSILHLVPNGLNDPTILDQGGWGGRYETVKRPNIWSGGCPVSDEGRFGDFHMYGDAADKGTWERWGSRTTRSPYNTILRWRVPYQNDFAARMDWCSQSPDTANHAPIAVVDGDDSLEILERTVMPGETLSLDAGASTDPDGDNLAFHWWIYEEAGSYRGQVRIDDPHNPAPAIQIPDDAAGRQIHVILTLTDDGDPPLTAYRRIVIDVH